VAEILAIGPRSFRVALAGIGAEPVPCETPGDFAEVLRGVALEKDARLVFAPEDYLQAAPEAVAAFRARSDAALLGLPRRASHAHPSFDDMRSLIEQATGASLI
jgi:vacuolar-type H+-ATPase subunit F/Vma7